MFKFCGYPLCYSTAGTCRAYLNLSCVTERVLSMGNFICSHGLNHHQICELLSEIQAVGWISSSSKVLLWCFELRAKTKMFLNEKNHLQPLRMNWLWKLDFAADLIMVLNEFNLRVQGKTVLICETYTAIKWFRKANNLMTKGNFLKSAMKS